MPDENISQDVVLSHIDILHQTDPLLASTVTGTTLLNFAQLGYYRDPDSSLIQKVPRRTTKRKR